MEIATPIPSQQKINIAYLGNNVIVYPALTPDITFWINILQI